MESPGPRVKYAVEHNECLRFSSKKKGAHWPPSPGHSFAFQVGAVPTEFSASVGDVLPRGPQTFSINVQRVNTSGLVHHIELLLLLLFPPFPLSLLPLFSSLP